MSINAEADLIPLTIISKDFQATDADIVVRSSDDIDYHLHRKNLILAAGTFPLEEASDSPTVLQVSESSETLDVLFHFLYPQQYLTLDDTNFENLLLIAEAAEKYQIPAAMYGCQVQFRKFLQSKPKELLAFGTKHDYPSIVFKLAPVLVDTPISELNGRLSSQLYVAWSIYRENWLNACHMTSIICPQHYSCACWGPFALDVLRKLEKPSALLELQALVNPSESGYQMENCCKAAAIRWKEDIGAMVANIPPIASLISSEPAIIFAHYWETNGDVTIQSSDGQNFLLHKKNLAFYTEGFPCAETPTAEDIVALSESATTLEILFQFVYPRRFPDLDKLSFGSTLLLAEAAEKYVVHAAIYACKFRLYEFIDSEPKELLSFAAKHNYYSLIVRLAPCLIDLSLLELSEILPSHVYVPWSIHRERWLSVMHTAAKGGYAGCKCWDNFFELTILRNLDQPSRLTSPEVLSNLSGMCKRCASRKKTWQSRVAKAVNDIPRLRLGDV